MASTRENGVTVPTNDMTYNLTGDLAIMADSINPVIPVPNATARNALTTYTGLTVTRNDVTGQPLEVWNGSSWQRQSPKANAASSRVGSGMAANDFITGTKQPYWQAGTTVATTDPSGNIGIVYPAAFPNGVIVALASNGDSNSGNLIIVPAGAFTQTTAVFYVNVKMANTGANIASSGVRVDWFAFGW